MPRPDRVRAGLLRAERWNTAYPPGTRVRYWLVLPPLGVGDDEPIDTVTRSEAWVLGSGTPVVLVEGRTGGVHLSHLAVL
jgi:hypothetical protein